ncbi:MAG: 2-amino-4-hydroxy-6-hydroxymethyldihydropteridine diphosphokinase [Microscillaceae bacterium]|nr:2-amino-4-hydroxy-6-hydroxymethyldihydropteridine diphosphokinase [Microscillaceae bacterium]
MYTTYLLLGSNLGEKKLNIDYAAELIGWLIGEITRKSSVYQTSSWGVENQPPFYNQVLEVITKLQPADLILDIQYIENKLGRERGVRWGSRIIDIDILYYEHEVINFENLTVPHPEIPNRKFTLIPLAEIAPDYVHPMLQKTNAKLLEECKDTLPVQKIA